MEIMDNMTSGFDFICPFSYKTLWLYAKKGNRILITENPKEVEELFGRISWFDTALSQAVKQHLCGCLTENIQVHLTYINHGA